MEPIQKQEISRREFLGYAATALFSLVGIGALVEALSNKGQINSLEKQKSKGAKGAVGPTGPGAYQLLSQKNKANGYAGLDNNGFVPLALLPAQALTLNGNSDVSVANPSNDQVLSYDSSSGKWVNRTFSVGSSGKTTESGVSSVNDMTGSVSITSAGLGALNASKNLSDLVSASAARINLGLGSAAVLNAGTASGVATLDTSGNVPDSQLGNALLSTTKLSGLADTSAASAASNNQVLAYNSTTLQWVPATASSSTVSDATNASKGILQLDGDLGGTAASPTVPGLTTKVSKSGDTMTGTLVLPSLQVTGGTPANGKILTSDNSGNATWQTAPSAPVTSVNSLTGNVNLTASSVGAVPTSQVGAASGVASLDSGGNVPLSELGNVPGAADATPSSKGVVQLDGDLGGTAASPTVPGLTTKVSKSGDTMTGDLILPANPGEALGAAPKQYVDAETARAESAEALLIPRQNAYSFPRLHLSLANVLAGVSGDRKIAFIGDSTTYGVGGTDGIGALLYLSKLLQSSGYPTALGFSIPKTPGAVGNDSRWGIGSGWSNSSGNYSFGGQAAVWNSTNSAAANTLTFTPSGYLYDTFDVWYITKTLGGTMTINVYDTTNGTTATNTISTAASSSIQKVTLTASVAATDYTVGIGAITGIGGVSIAGIEPYLSSTPKLRLANMGSPGATANTWTLTGGGAISPINCLEAYAPDVGIIDLGINDADLTFTTSQYLGYLLTIVQAVQLTGDCIVVAPEPIGTSGAAQLAQYAAALPAFCQTNNCYFADLFTRWGGTNGPTALEGYGYYYDTVHPSVNVGYPDVARFHLANILGA